MYIRVMTGLCEVRGTCIYKGLFQTPLPSQMYIRIVKCILHLKLNTKF